MKFPWLAMSIIGWVIVLAYSLVPTSNWYELESVEMTADYAMTKDGILSRVINVDRTIHKPFKGWYRVEEQVLLNEKWLAVIACENVFPVQYRPDAELPPEITVDWWTWGDCSVLPAVSFVKPAEESYRLCTWVEIEIVPLLSFLRKRIEPVCTNAYQGRSVPDRV